MKNMRMEFTDKEFMKLKKSKSELEWDIKRLLTWGHYFLYLNERRIKKNGKNNTNR